MYLGWHLGIRKSPATNMSISSKTRLTFTIHITSLTTHIRLKWNQSQNGSIHNTEIWLASSKQEYVNNNDNSWFTIGKGTLIAVSLSFRKIFNPLILIKIQEQYILPSRLDLQSFPKAHAIHCLPFYDSSDNPFQLTRDSQMTYNEARLICP